MVALEPCMVWHTGRKTVALSGPLRSTTLGGGGTRDVGMVRP